MHKDRGKSVKVQATLDRFTTACRNARKELYGTEQASLIGPIKWVEDKAMEVRPSFIGNGNASNASNT